MMSRISSILFLFMLVELCLGGGGRFTAVGPVSLRMILFSMALVVGTVQFIKGKSFPFEIGRWMIGFVFMISIGMAVGMANHNPIKLIYEDVKPLCYFFVLPFF